MSSRLSFVKKHLVIEHLQKAQKDSGIFVVAIEKTEFPKNYNPQNHVSGSAILAKSLKNAVEKAKLAPQSLQVIVMGSSLLATGHMPALTDNFSVLFGTTFGTYIMNNSSGLKPLFQTIKQIKFNKKGIVAMGSLQKPKQFDLKNRESQIQFKEVRKQEIFNDSKQKGDKRLLWKFSEKQKIDFIKSLTEKNKMEGNQVQLNFEAPDFEEENHGIITKGGACSMILMSGQRISRCQNLQPLAKILAYSESPVNPSNIFISLFSSITICLQRARLTIEDIDYFEFREQFPIIPLAISKMFKIDNKRINVHQEMMTIGGPSKVNGVAVVQNLISLMKEKGGKFGLAGICNEGGMSTSIIVANVFPQKN